MVVLVPKCGGWKVWPREREREGKEEKGGKRENVDETNKENSGYIVQMTSFSAALQMCFF